MKCINLFLCCVIAAFFVGCGKKNNQKLAKTYFKTAFMELADDRKGNARLQSALHNINLAIEQSPQPEYLALKATILQYQGYTRESMAFFDKALALPMEPGLKAQIMNNFACVQAQSGEYARAKEIWQELAASSWYPTPEVAWVNLGKVYLEDNDPIRAKEAFKTATTLAPAYVDAHFYLAVAAQAAGQQSLARAGLEAVFKLEPEHRPAQAFGEKYGLLVG